MYTDVFGSNTLPPSEYGYNSLTITVDTTLVWPYNSDNTNNTLAKIVQVSCQSGNAVTLPDARQVSVGEDFLFRNTGANALIVKDASGAQIASVDSGAASYFYLTDNTTLAGVFGVIGFGVGTSTADAASLVGYGVKAVGASLNQSHPVVPYASGTTIGTDHRSKLVVFTGGASTFTLTSAVTLGDDYFTLFRNEGTGTATIDPSGAETIDGTSALQVQPGESLILICTGTQWYSVGYGRSVLYQFTQLTKDVSAGGSFTLSSAEASNKLITFIGNPPSSVTVVVPSVVAVYYLQSSVSTSQTITFKTAAGSGVGLSQGVRAIALCDGTDVVSAQSAVANASVSLTDGSAVTPSLFFATKTNTGLFKSGTQDVGVTVNGSPVGVFGSAGLQTSTLGPNSTQRHTLPAVASDTVTLNAATQTLTNKTISVDNNTIAGVAASSFVVSDASGNLDGTAAQKAIPLGAVVGTTDTQTLTNKTLSTDSNTISGIAASSFVLSDASGNLDGTAVQKVIPAGVVVGTTDNQTLTNKTIVVASNTITTAASGNLTSTNLNAALAELQADIDTRQPVDATLTALAGVTTAANKLIYATGSDTFGTTDLTAAGRALLDDADASAQRATLELGTAATANTGTSAGNVVVLDGSAKLPAVDGSQLTNLPASGLSGASSAETLTGSITNKAITPGSFAGNKSLGSNGYYKFPGGLIVQWGVATASPTPAAVTFPTAFLNGVYAINMTPNLASGQYYQLGYSSATLSGFNAYSSSGSVTVTWIAIGS